MLEKEHQSDVDSTNICIVQTHVENQSADCLKNCNEQIEESKKHTANHDTEERVESSSSESCAQDPPMLVGEEGEVKKLENTGLEAKVLCSESETSKNTFEKGGDPLEKQDPISGLSESEVKADICTVHLPNDFPTCLTSESKVHQPVSSPLSELSENVESVVNEEK